MTAARTLVGCMVRTEQTNSAGTPVFGLSQARDAARRIVEEKTPDADGDGVAETTTVAYTAPHRGPDAGDDNLADGSPKIATHFGNGRPSNHRHGGAESAGRLRSRGVQCSGPYWLLEVKVHHHISQRGRNSRFGKITFAAGT